jgi:hypothetical protein
MKDAKKLKLGDAHITPRNIQEVQASKLGDARYVSNVSIIFDAPCLFLHHLL